MAASLGLKVAALPPKPAPRPAAAPPPARAPAPSSAKAPDLMGGLESPPRKVQHSRVLAGLRSAFACDDIMAEVHDTQLHVTPWGTWTIVTRVDLSSDAALP